jgi:hypothetical protein
MTVILVAWDVREFLCFMVSLSGPTVYQAGAILEHPTLLKKSKPPGLHIARPHHLLDAHFGTGRNPAQGRKKWGVFSDAPSG